MTELPTIERVILGVFAAVCLASAAAWLAPLGWPFELFAHFRLQLLLVAGALVPLLMLVRRPLIAVVAAIMASAHWLPTAPGLQAHDLPADCGDQSLVVVTANVEVGNRDTQRLLAWLRENPADVMVVQEVDSVWAARLVELTAYPYRHMIVRNDPHGIALLSRWPLASVTRLELAPDAPPALSAVVTVHGARLRVIGLHARWPITPHHARQRDQVLQAVAVQVRTERLPVVVFGDLNLTPYSPVFAQLLRAAGLRDAGRNAGWQPTWMASFWPLALRIDHVLVTPGICVQQIRTGPSIGSDHRPLRAHLRF
jgi:endonuclease/exonuclease/phosphatase (EEP) superfamily protein YafD